MSRYRVIESRHCPCEQCCGETVGTPEIWEGESLRDAVRAFLDPEFDEGESLPETSCCPWQPGSWLRRTGVMWGSSVPDPCEDFWGEEVDEAAEVSLHLSGVTGASERRIFKLLGAYGL